MKNHLLYGLFGIGPLLFSPDTKTSDEIFKTIRDVPSVENAPLSLAPQVIDPRMTYSYDASISEKLGEILSTSKLVSHEGLTSFGTDDTIGGLETLGDNPYEDLAISFDDLDPKVGENLEKSSIVGTLVFFLLLPALKKWRSKRKKGSSQEKLKSLEK